MYNIAHIMYDSAIIHWDAQPGIDSRVVVSKMGGKSHDARQARFSGRASQSLPPLEPPWVRELEG
jgi:hypothetical protein